MSARNDWHTQQGTDSMGWLRIVGFLKFKVFFAEYSLFYRALLQKEPIISRNLLRWYKLQKIAKSARPQHRSLALHTAATGRPKQYDPDKTILFVHRAQVARG